MYHDVSRCINVHTYPSTSIHITSPYISIAYHLSENLLWIISMEIAMDVDTPKKHGPAVDVSTMAQLLAQSTASNVPRFVGRHKEVASKSALLRLPVVCIHSPAVESKSGNPPGKCYGNPYFYPAKKQRKSQENAGKMPGNGFLPGMVREIANSLGLHEFQAGELLGLWYVEVAHGGFEPIYI